MRVDEVDHGVRGRGTAAGPRARARAEGLVRRVGRGHVRVASPARRPGRTRRRLDRRRPLLRLHAGTTPGPARRGRSAADPLADQRRASRAARWRPRSWRSSRASSRTWDSSRSPTASSRSRWRLGCELGRHGWRGRRAGAAHPRATGRREQHERPARPRLGLSRPRYEGVTGPAAFLQDASTAPASQPSRCVSVCPTTSAMHATPLSSAALLRHLEHVLGVPTRHTELRRDIERWRSLHY